MSRLWPHQNRCLNELAEAIASGQRKICVTSPTGGGKSRIVFEHIIRANEPISLYTDRVMLKEQLARNMTEAGLSFGIRAAGHEEDWADVQICMIQSEVSRCVKGGRTIHPAKQVIFDEAHKQVADTSIAIRELHGDVIDIGVTATPLGIGHVYDHLIIAGTNSELRECGALVPAHTYGPDEPDTKWVGTVKVDDGECGIAKSKRMEFAKRVFGSVVEHYHQYNPEQRPALLFAPGVPEAMYFCEQLTEAGIPTAHIDGKNCVIDGQVVATSPEVRDEIAARSLNGDIKVVTNRFVLREGIDWPWIYHGIFATVFGSLTSYLQSGGRILRAHPSLDRVVIQDHGGNWWRHGSLNANRDWKLEYTDRIVAGLREKNIREKKEPEPIVCVKCGACRLSGATCAKCGYQYVQKSRVVLQKDGIMREMKGDIFRARRILSESQKIRDEWSGRVRAIRNSKKPTVQTMTFAQLDATFARDHNWQYAPRTCPSMPIKETDWFRPIKDVPMGELTR